jgi:hypothetical protein
MKIEWCWTRKQDAVELGKQNGAELGKQDAVELGNRMMLN